MTKRLSGVGGEAKAAASPARLSHNTITLAVSNTGGAVLSFLLSVLIGRTLGQDGLGVYTAALAWVFPLSLAAEFGIATLMTRDLAADPDAAPDYLRTAALARLLLGGGLTLALVIVAPFLSDSAAVVRGLQISAPIIVLLPFFSMFTAVFRARRALWPIPWLNIGMLAAQVMLTALVFLSGGDVLSALAVNTLTSAGQLAAAWWVWKRWFSGTSHDGASRAAALRLTRLLERAWPFAAAAVLAALQLRLSAVLLERLAITAELGYYAAATRFVEAGRVVPNALFGALLPALAALAPEPAAAKRMLRQTMFGLTIFAAALGVVFAVFGDGILRLTFGAAFEAGVPALHIAMWGLLPGLLRGAQTLYRFACGQERLANAVNVMALIMQLALGLALIPQYGAAGAAAGGLVVDAVALVLLWRLPVKRQATPETRFQVRA